MQLRMILHKPPLKDYTEFTMHSAMLTMNAPGMIAETLRAAGLRPTRQRLALAKILFGNGDRHVSAEDLHREACAAKVLVSVATVYNTLNQFTAAGLLREVAIDRFLSGLAG